MPATTLTPLTPLASRLHSLVWPFVAVTMRERCETIADENAMMNREVPRLAPHICRTPLLILANIWGVSPVEAAAWRFLLQAALEELS